MYIEYVNLSLIQFHNQVQKLLLETRRSRRTNPRNESFSQSCVLLRNTRPCSSNQRGF